MWPSFGASSEFVGEYILMRSARQLTHVELPVTEDRSRQIETDVVERL